MFAGNLFLSRFKRWIKILQIIVSSPQKIVYGEPNIALGPVSEFASFILVFGCTGVPYGNFVGARVKAFRIIVPSYWAYLGGIYLKI